MAPVRYERHREQEHGDQAQRQGDAQLDVAAAHVAALHLFMALHACLPRTMWRHRLPGGAAAPSANGWSYEPTGGHLAARFGAATAHLGAARHQLVAARQALAVLGAPFARFGADAAYARVQF